MLFELKKSSRKRTLKNTIGDGAFFHFLMQVKPPAVEKVFKDLFQYLCETQHNYIENIKSAKDRKSNNLFMFLTMYKQKNAIIFLWLNVNETLL